MVVEGQWTDLLLSWMGDAGAIPVKDHSAEGVGSRIGARAIPALPHTVACIFYLSFSAIRG
ncbi:hypothetical protein ETAR_12900 [Edwardsiella tarda]